MPAPGDGGRTPIEPDAYRTLAREGMSDFTEKKSRFIGIAAPALWEADALAFLEGVRARYPDCSAVLFAYLCGWGGEVQRYHDAHEPSGGLLMLEALKRQNVTGAAVAVVRYFGGVHLGAGPLGRAFGRAAAEAVAAAGPCTLERSLRYRVDLDYSLSGRVERFFERSPHRLLGLQYGAALTVEALVRAGEESRFLREMADLTGGQAAPALVEQTYSQWE